MPIWLKVLKYTHLINEFVVLSCFSIHVSICRWNFVKQCYKKSEFESHKSKQNIDDVYSCALFQTSQPDLCNKFNQGAAISYRTHYFYLEYLYNVFSEHNVALVTQCSVDRLASLQELSKHWAGSISVALYLNDMEVQNFLEFYERSEELKARKNIAYHIVYKEGVYPAKIVSKWFAITKYHLLQEFYPINYLRNVAMEHLSAPYVFHLDIDFLPQLGLHELLMDYVARLNLDEAKKVALIVPAFETQRYRYIWWLHLFCVEFFSLIIFCFAGTRSQSRKPNYWSCSVVVLCTLFVTTFGLRGMRRLITVSGEVLWSHMKYWIIWFRVHFLSYTNEFAI